MPRGHNYWKLKRQRATDRGRAMAHERWRRDRLRRAQLAALAPEQAPNHIVRRIIVIDGERDVRETVLWSWDSARECRRKLRDVLHPAPSVCSVYSVVESVKRVLTAGVSSPT